MSASIRPLPVTGAPFLRGVSAERVLGGQGAAASPPTSAESPEDKASPSDKRHPWPAALCLYPSGATHAPAPALLMPCGRGRLRRLAVNQGIRVRPSHRCPRAPQRISAHPTDSQTRAGPTQQADRTPARNNP